jgi:kynureninase
VLVDVGEDFNINPEAINAAITDRTRAIMPVHYSGQACDLAAIYELASRQRVVERFDLSIVAEQISLVYRKLLIRKGLNHSAEDSQ